MAEKREITKNNAYFFEYIDSLIFSSKNEEKIPSSHYFDYIIDLYFIKQKLDADEKITPMDTSHLEQLYVSKDVLLSVITNIVL